MPRDVTDADLLALIGKAPKTAAQPEQNLPDIDLSMLLSPSAQREVEAAQGLVGSAPPVVEAHNDFADATAYSLFATDNEAMDGSVQSALEEPAPEPVNVASVPLEALWGGMEREGLEEAPGAAPAPQVEAGLESLFMNREAQEAASLLQGGGFPPPVASPTPEFDIQMGMDWSPDPRTPTPQGSMERVRFQIGRQDPPPAAPPMRREASWGGSDGVVVSRRGTDGRFQPQRIPQTAQARPPTFEQRAASAPPVAPPPRPAAPTLMQHLMLDDD